MKSDTVKDMQLRIKAILLECMSSESGQYNICCPHGTDSWCYYQEAKANGEAPVIPTTCQALSKSIGTPLLPLFKRLSCPELPNRCTRKKMQDANESFKEVLRQKCQELHFCDCSTLEMGLFMAVKQFNENAMGHLDILAADGLVVGESAVSSTKKRTAQSLKAAAMWFGKGSTKA